MRSVVRAERVTLDDVILAINANEARGCYMEVLDSLKSQMDAFLSHHARMLFVRVDIRQHTYTDDNKPISDLMRKLNKWLKRTYRVTRIGYLWVRELEKAKQQHYHLVLMVSAKEVQHPARIIQEVERIAEGWGWPKPWTPDRCFYVVRRTDSRAYGEAFYRGSYLAKERGKGYKGLTAKNYGSSNIKPRQA